MRTIPPTRACWVNEAAPWQRYALACGAVLAALVVRALLDSVLQDRATFSLFYPGIIIAAWFGGWGPGLFATVLSTILVEAIFVGPRYNYWITNAGELLECVVFVSVGMVTSYMAHMLREDERRLAREREWLRVTVGSLAEGVVATDMEGRIVFANEAAARILGLSIDYWEKCPVLDALGFSDETQRSVVTALQQARLGEDVTPLGELSLKRDGAPDTFLQAHVMPIRGEQGPIGALLVVSDVTARHDAQHRLDEAREVLSALVNAVPACIAYVNAEERYMVANRVYEQWFGGSPVGKTVQEFLGANYGLSSDALRRAREGESVMFERPLTMPDGTIRTCLVNYMPHRDERDGRVQGLVVHVVDVTGRREEELAQARELESRVAERTAELVAANQELEAFSYSISHDLRAPLRSLDAFSEAVLMDPESKLSASSRDYLERVRRAADRMNRLTTDLLAYTRLTREEIRLTPVDLEGAVLDAIRFLDEEIKNCAARVEVRSPMPRVMAHESALFQVMVNLVGNSLKFTPAGRAPRVTISADGVEESDRARLRVSDNGIGVPEVHRERIFGMFERLHTSESYSGSGLGLTLVRRAVERMGGTVGVEPSSEGGSCFWVELEKAH